MTGNVISSEVYALMYVMLSKGENHVPYGELVGTAEHIPLQRDAAQSEVVNNDFNCI
jgi:hypothetical protein